MKYSKKCNQSAFTLLEMATVLSVISLLAGTVVVAKNMRQNAILASIMDDNAKLVSAFNMFKNIYQGLPGDMADANPTKFGTTTQKGSTIVNGNGDGVIENGASQSEGVIALQHLGLAGLLKGDYTGTWSISAPSAIPYMPSIANRGDDGFYFSNVYSSSGSGTTAITKINTIITYAQIIDDNANGKIDWSGTASPYTSTEGMHAILSATEMLKIDQKYDDGSLNTGQIQAATGTNAPKSCSSGSSANIVQSGTGNNSYNFNACYFWFIIDY